MSTLATADAKSYDDVPFPTQPVPPSDPDRLAAIGLLFGLRPARVDRCRVLELGCASGGNLIPLAERLPESEFLGIDYSAGQLNTARGAAAALGLTNVELLEASIMDIGIELGTFDYVIAHGLYSWVPPAAREQVLALCKTLLEPAGIAYVSYNTYPGWCLPGIVRELVCSHAPAHWPTQQRLAEARKLLVFFSETLATDASAYSLLLKQEIDRVLASPDGYVAHEHLGLQNTPVYFHEFVERASAHGLQYVGDSLLHSMFASNVSQTVESQMQSVRHDAIAVEQYIDLLRNRAFRMSLVCHDSVPLRTRPPVTVLSELHFAGQFRLCSEIDFHTESEASFVAGGNQVFSTTAGVVKAAMYELGKAWPSSLSLKTLAAAVATDLDAQQSSLTDTNRATLDQFLLQSLASGIVEARSLAAPFVRVPGPRPRVSPLARAQARRATEVTNRRHEAVMLDEVSRNLLAYLDGEHDRSALLNVLTAAAQRGQLSILRQGVPMDRRQWTPEVLDPVLEQSLNAIAADALLLQ